MTYLWNLSTGGHATRQTPPHLAGQPPSEPTPAPHHPRRQTTTRQKEEILTARPYRPGYSQTPNANTLTVSTT
jgi:hypothetical protein